MKDPNCLFCKIVAGELPADKVYEDADTVAFLVIMPVNPGHTIVIPKEHYANIFETPADLWQKMAVATKKVAEAIRKGLPVEDLNVAMNNGAHSGQVVFHAHVHLIPRYKNDGHEAWHGTAYTEGQAAETAAKIKGSL